MLQSHKHDRAPTGGQPAGREGKAEQARRRWMRQQPARVHFTTRCLASDIEALSTLLACLWHDAERLSRRHVDAPHLALAVDAELAARLAHRLQAQLATALEEQVAA